MKDCVVIRTHRWGAQEDMLAAQLKSCFGNAVFAAFHNRDASVAVPVPCADFNDAWVVEQGLRAVPDYGWRCGDYALFAAHQTFPDYDRYWLIEPDVCLIGDVDAFFARAAEIDADGVGVDFETREGINHRFVKALPNVVPARATFALTRFSARAIAHLFDLRQAYSSGPAGNRFFANDEYFCFSHLNADPSFNVVALRTALSDWFDKGLFNPDPDILDRALGGIVAEGGNQICHPVRSIDSYLPALGDRLAHIAMRFLNGKNVQRSLLHLDEGERDALQTRCASHWPNV